MQKETIHRLLSFIALPLAVGAVAVAWGCGDTDRHSTPPDDVMAVRRDTVSSAPLPDPSVYGIDEVVAAMAPETVPVPSPDDTYVAGEEGDPRADGLRLFGQRQYLEAATALSLATRRQPGDWYTDYLLGLALWKSGDLEGAVDSLSRSAARKDDFARTHINLARVLNDAGQFSDALAAARRAVSLAPDNPVALYLAGRSLANLGRTDEAEQMLQASLRLDPENGEVLNRLGLLYLRHGRFAAAVGLLEEAVRRAPQRGYIHNNLGLCYEQLGRMSDARAEFAAGLEVGGDEARLQANLTRVETLPDRLEESAPRVVVASSPPPDPGAAGTDPHPAAPPDPPVDEEDDS
ncbi:MAG: tetratricopeptide repeat protein [Acidobacteriota bacterium]